MDYINKMIKETLDIFDAVQYAGNITAREAGYNKNYYLSPDLVVTYELFDYGPDHVYFGQYRHLAEKEYGNHIDPTKDFTLSQDEMFWAMEKAYRKISIRKSEGIVCIIEEGAGFRMTEYIKGSWEHEVRSLVRNDYHEA